MITCTDNRFTPKRVSEEIILTAKFDDPLARIDDTIVSAVVTVVVVAGQDDPSPDDIVIGSAQINDDLNRVSQLIGAGVDGTTYGILFTITTEEGQTMTGVGTLKVTNGIVP